MLLGLEQTSVEWVTDLVSTFSEAVELVLNTYSVTLTTVKTSLQLPGQGKYFGCEKYYACFQDVLSVLVEL